MKVLKGILLFLLAVSWCILQTLVGGVIALVLLSKARFRKYRGMVAVYHPYSFTFSLGTFAFISEKAESPRTVTDKQYGFYLLSCVYGPFYLLVVSLAQLVVRIPRIKKYRAERGIEPTDLFADRQAAYLYSRLDG